MTTRELEQLIGRKLGPKLMMVLHGGRCYSRVTTHPLWVEFDAPNAKGS